MELQQDVYQPQPVRQVQIPKMGKPGEHRMLGVPTIYDRVCQQALLNRLEPIFEGVFDLSAVIPSAPCPVLAVQPHLVWPIFLLKRRVFHGERENGPV